MAVSLTLWIDSYAKRWSDDSKLSSCLAIVWLLFEILLPQPVFVFAMFRLDLRNFIWNSVLLLKFSITRGASKSVAYTHWWDINNTDVHTDYDAY